MSDNEIVLRVSNGEAFLFEELYRRYQGKLIKYVSRLGLNGEAEDVVQNTFIKVWTNLKGFNHDYQFNGWVYRICHNEAMNCYRLKQRDLARFVSLDDDQCQSEYGEITRLVELVPCQQDGPVEDLKKKERREVITEALSMLKPRQGDILMDFVYYNMSYEEIGIKYGMNIQTVGTHISRSRRQLSEFQMVRDLVF